MKFQVQPIRAQVLLLVDPTWSDAAPARGALALRRARGSLRELPSERARPLACGSRAEPAAGGEDRRGRGSLRVEADGAAAQVVQRGTKICPCFSSESICAVNLYLESHLISSLNDNCKRNKPPENGYLNKSRLV